MRRVLVTGGCGFIGSAFVNDVLRDPSMFVCNVDAMYPCGTPHNVCAAGAGAYVLVPGRLQDLDIEGLLDAYHIDTVVHFAAQSHVDGSFANPLQYTQDNVVATHALLDACRRYQERTGRLYRFMHMSTDEVYGESQLHDDHAAAKTELSLTCPTNPYAATKLGAEALVLAYRASYGLPVQVIRSNNVYGPRQYPEKVIPRFITQLHKGQRCTVHGDGEQVRAFIHVDDVVSAIRRVLDAGNVGDIYNISAPQEISMRGLVTELVWIMHGPLAEVDDYITPVTDRPFNDRRYFISADKLKTLGWEPRVSFDKGLAATVQWYTHTIQVATYWERPTRT